MISARPWKHAVHADNCVPHPFGAVHASVANFFFLIGDPKRRRFRKRVCPSLFCYIIMKTHHGCDLADPKLEPAKPNLAFAFNTYKSLLKAP